MGCKKMKTIHYAIRYSISNRKRTLAKKFTLTEWRYCCTLRIQSVWFFDKGLWRLCR